MRSCPRHWVACESPRQGMARAFIGNGRTNHLSPNISLDQLPAQPPNFWSSLIWLRRSTNARATIAAGCSWTAAKTTAAVGAICAIAATARRFAGIENVWSANRELTDKHRSNSTTRGNTEGWEYG